MTDLNSKCSAQICTKCVSKAFFYKVALYLKVLSLAVWDALSVLALAPLIALGVVSHGSGGWTGGLVARAHRLLLAGGVVVTVQQVTQGG